MIGKIKRESGKAKKREIGDPDRSYRKALISRFFALSLSRFFVSSIICPMRIIGGKHRSRKLLPPIDEATTRPITDRVKVAVFDRLWAAGLLEGGNVIDIFSGTGSLGLEALSRGMDHCTFIERDRSAKERLETNITEIGLTKCSEVLSVNAMATSWILSLSHKPIKLVFCDPPYVMMEEEASRKSVLDILVALTPHMDEGGVCMVRTPAEIETEIVEGWMEPKRHNYGSMTLHFYQRPLPADL